MVKINIVLVTYNRPFYLRQAIDSILNQSYTNFNLIILDNGSDSETKKILSTLNDSRIRIVTNKLNSREFINNAFNFTDCEYIMLTHDDDLMNKNFLKYQLNQLELNKQIDLLACRINLINDKSIFLGKIRPRIFKSKIWRKGEYIKQYFFSGNIIPCPTIIFRSDFIKKNKLKYNWSVGPAVDLFLLFEANIIGVLALSKKPLYNYRIHPNQDSELNRLALELQVKPYIIDLLKNKNLNNLVYDYNSASNGIILNILFEGFFSRRLSYSQIKKNISNLKKNYNLKLNKHSLFWSLIGVFRGVKNYIKT